MIVRRVLHHILTILRFGDLPTAMCYDCACTLKLFIRKHFDSDDLRSTDFTKFLTSLTMAIDRFHVKNHKRHMCKTVMRPDDPSHNDIYSSINTQVAEQMFAYMSKFKSSFRGYSYPKSTIFFTILFHLKNCMTTGISSFQQAVWEISWWCMTVLCISVWIFLLFVSCAFPHFISFFFRYWTQNYVKKINYAVYFFRHFEFSRISRTKTVNIWYLFTYWVRPCRGLNSWYLFFTNQPIKELYMRFLPFEYLKIFTVWKFESLKILALSCSNW